MLDIFAWIVLIVLIICVVTVILFLAALPGRIARERGHPWPDAVAVAGWVSVLFGFTLWPFALVWAYLDAPTRSENEASR
ncbi:Inner membrane protein YiaW [Afipia felis]